MISDILYFLKAAIFLIVFVLVMMTPFMGYLYWLNNKQNRYFKRLGKALKLEYKSLGNVIRRDFPELNGFINGVQVFIGARRTKGRTGSSAATRNHYPIILMQVATNKFVERFKLDVTGKEIKYSSVPQLNMNANTLTALQNFAKQHGNVVILQENGKILQAALNDELSNQKQYDKTKALAPLLVELALDINKS
ncbi:MAG: hypothetical protein ACWA41_02105 [Putridiphycobacter sp.]